MAEVQTQILEAAKAAGVLAGDVVDGVRSGKRDRATAASSPLLKLALERAGVGKAELDRLLEKFWAQAGARRAQLHRLVEEQVVACYLVEAGLAGDEKVAVAERELEERSAGGDPVRLLSILVDSGTIDENAARQTVTEVQKGWRYCKYCLSSFRSGGGDGSGGNGASDACAVCGRPLTVAARAYEIVKLTTIAEDAPKEKGPVAAAGTPVPKAAMAPPEVGETIGGVKLLEKIDDEGRGTVFRGERAGDKAARAVKVWRLGKELTLDDVARFETAATSATKLEHAGILKVYEAGEDRGRHFVVSEWVKGKTIKKLVEEKGPLPPERAVPLLKATLEAIEAAHKEKLLHKNVGPGNVITQDAGGVKVGDFGVCKDYGVSLDTVRGNVIGSPDYLAPEQCQGLKSDERTDLFSIGATFYFALSGKKPFEGDSTVTLIVKRLTSDPKPLKDVAPKVPKELCDIIAKLMARKPDERFPNAREALVAIQRWEARVEAGIAGTEETGKAKKVLAVVAALLFVALVAGGAVLALTHFLSGPSESLLRAVAEARRMADGDRLIEAAERLTELARQEGGSGPASMALDDFGGRALARANELARQKNHPAAISLVKRMRPAVSGAGLGSETALAEAERSLEEKREAYEREAKEEYEKVLHAAETSSEATALKAWRAYREAYPNQPLDDAARVAEEKLAGRGRQAELMAEAERLAGAGDPDGARRSLADAIAMGTLPESMEPRKRKVERLIDFALHLREGDRLIDEGETEAAVKELQRAGEVIPDRPEVKLGIARARYEAKMKLAAEEEDGGNLIAAVARLKEAESVAQEAGLDLGPVREKRRDLESALKTAKENEQKGLQRIAEADRAMRSGDYRGALRAYRDAERLVGPTPQVQDGIARATANLGAGDEEKAFDEARRKAEKASGADPRAKAWREFLDLYPDGPHAGAARDALAKLGVPLRPEEGGSAASVRPPKLRPGEREGEFVNPTDGSIMVRVPRGKFRRGTSPEERKTLAAQWRIEEKEVADESPQKEVFLDDFFIDAFEVTNADFALFLAAIAADSNLAARLRHEAHPPGKTSHEPKYWGDIKWARPELPVVGVDWFDAWSYARWAGKRLPTEAEWEKAARGTDGRAYPWGELPSPFASNTAEAWLGRRITDKADWRSSFVDKAPWKERGLTVSQSSFPGDRSPYGGMHFGGNIWEWCEDWYHPDAYAKLGDKNPVMKQMGTSKRRVTRGGSWFDPPYLARAASRKNALDPESRNFTTGFRCARSAEGAGK